jgi:ABC-type antimicrobial peptide transport system ATPase subunit
LTPSRQMEVRRSRGNGIRLIQTAIRAVTEITQSPIFKLLKEIKAESTSNIILVSWKDPKKTMLWLTEAATRATVLVNAGQGVPARPSMHLAIHRCRRR